MVRNFSFSCSICVGNVCGLDVDKSEGTSNESDMMFVELRTDEEISSPRYR